MAKLQLAGLSKRFGAETAVDAIDLDVTEGALFCLLGPSGCGKTTLLRLIGGYYSADAGHIRVDGDDLTHLPPERRDIGMVFQNYALFPHLSARDNVAFGLHSRRLSAQQRRERIEAMLDRVGLSQAERGRRPRALSGGQQQRVALARALVIEPRLLLLDEPMANLDKHLREQMREEIRELQQRTGVTTLLVTHDQEEALSLASHLGVMMNGRVIQSATPETLYNRHTDARAARFLGEANLLDVRRADAHYWHLDGGIRLPAVGNNATVPETVMIRPEHIRPANGSSELSGRLDHVTFMGADCMMTVRLPDATRLLMRSRRGDQPVLTPGQTLGVEIDPAGVWPLPRS